MVREDADGRSSQGIIPVVIFLSVVMTVLLLMGAITAGAVFLLYPSAVPFPYYIASFAVIEAFVMASMVIISKHHHRALAPLNLLSMLILAATFYSLLASVPIYLFMLVDIIFSLDPALHVILRLSYPMLIFSPIIWGIVEARSLRSKRIRLKTEKEFARGLRIAFASDIHLGLLVGRRRMNEIAKRILAFSPDVIVLGGDIYDTPPRNIPWAGEILRRLSASAPTYFITGNHETFHDPESIISHVGSMSISALRGQSEKVPGIPVTIHGMDDPTDLRTRPGERPSLPDNISGSDGSFHIFAYHRPLLFPEAAARGIDLQLSGHTHAGQIFPFNLVTYIAFGRYHRGLHRIGSSYLYTSNGAATWGPPVRFLAPPEIVSIEVI